jgi:hypothetical protein
VGEETVLHLAHWSEPAGDIEVAVAESGWTNVYGPHGHSEVYGMDVIDDAWEAELVSSLAEVLQGHYEVKTAGWRSPRVQVDYGCQRQRR